MASTRRSVRMVTPRANRASVSSVGQAGRAVGEGPEHRGRNRGGSGRGGPGRSGGPDPTESVHEASRLVRHRDQYRHHRGGTEVVDTTGVDPAYQGVDQALDHRASESFSDDLPDRPVAHGRTQAPVWFDQVPGHPQRLRRGEDPRPEQGPPPGRDTEVQPVGHGPEPAPRPDGGARRPYRDQLVGGVELVDQPGGLGPPAQEGIGGQVDRPAVELGGAELASGPTARLQDMDDRGRASVPARGRDQFPGRRQPGDPGPDDGDGRPAVGHAGGAEPDTAGAVPGPACATERRTTPARMSRNLGSSLRDEVRVRVIPTDRATSRASMSRS